MSATLEPDPRTAVLRQEVGRLHTSLGDLQDALRGVNDPAWRDAYMQTVAVGYAVVELHIVEVRPSIADDAANLRSAVQRHDVPREDPDLGPIEWLKHLRGARAVVVADAEAILKAAEAIGLVPAELSFTPPSQIQFDRAGMEGLLTGLEKRLTGVEAALKAIEREGDSAQGVSIQQIGIVNFFIKSMDVEVALAKLEASAKAALDFAALGRAIEAMGELTADFVATVTSIPGKFTTALLAGSKIIRTRVARVAGGLRAMVHRVRHGRTRSAPAEPVLLGHNSGDVEATDSEIFWDAIEHGDDAQRHGDLGASRHWYDKASAIAQRLVVGEPGNAHWQRDLSVSLNGLGNVEMASGNFARAREHYEAGLGIAERLAAQEPGNAHWQRDLSVSHNRLGNIAVAAGDLGEAKQRFGTSNAIFERLAAGEPDNAQWQRDLSVSHERLGDIAVAAGDLGEARRWYEAGLIISERLAAQEPDNTERQRDLSVSHNKLGDIAEAAGDPREARRRFEAGHAIAEQLAAQEPGNAEWQRDLSVSYNNLGDIAMAAGNLHEARRLFGAGLAIRERLTTRQPDNAEWQRDLSYSHTALGTIEAQAGNLDPARSHFAVGLEIDRHLAALEPQNIVWQHDTAISYLQIAGLDEAQGDIASAKAALEQAEAIVVALIDRTPDDYRYLRDLENIRADLARLRAA